MIVGLIVEKYDHKKVGLISVVGSYTGGSYNERGVYLISFIFNSHASMLNLSIAILIAICTVSAFDAWELSHVIPDQRKRCRLMYMPSLIFSMYSRNRSKTVKLKVMSHNLRPLTCYMYIFSVMIVMKHL